MQNYAENFSQTSPQFITTCPANEMSKYDLRELLGLGGANLQALVDSVLVVFFNMLVCRKNAFKHSYTVDPEKRALLFSKIRSCVARTDLQNMAFSLDFCLFLRSDLTVQDRILKIRVLASLGNAGTGCVSECELKTLACRDFLGGGGGIGVVVKGVAGSDAIVAQ